MNSRLKEKILTQYPSWHSQPLRLSVQEINDPRKVVAEFFECYSLPNIRACLRQWLEDALLAEEAATTDHFTTHEHIEKLIEASWLLHNSKQKNPRKKKK